MVTPVLPRLISGQCIEHYKPLILQRVQSSPSLHWQRVHSASNWLSQLSTF